MQMEPLSKKPRPYDDAYGAVSAPGMNGDPSMYSMPGMPSNNYGIPSAMPGENGDQECRRYNAPEGCPYGTGCRFKHGPNARTKRVWKFSEMASVQWVVDGNSQSVVTVSNFTRPDNMVFSPNG